MKLLYKDLVLAVHPTFYIFTLLGCLVLAPAYPYTVVFLFGCLAPYISFMYARETNDAWYTATLPPPMEIIRVLMSIPLFRLHFKVMVLTWGTGSSVMTTGMSRPRSLATSRE